MQNQDSDRVKVDIAFDKLVTYIKKYTQEEIESALDELKDKYTDNVDKHTPDVRVTKQSPFMPSFMPVQNVVAQSIQQNVADDEYNVITHPSHYCSHGVETIDKIEAVINGLPAKEAYLLSNVLKYVDRAGLKDDAEQDLNKANAYAYRLIFGKWPENA